MKTIQSWNWRGLTLCGRILIIKKFPIPKVLYCKKEIDRILYSFIWKGRDKVKRVSLINDVNEGGLKLPRIESMIDAQRITCIQKF